MDRYIVTSGSWPRLFLDDRSWRMTPGGAGSNGVRDSVGEDEGVALDPELAAAHAAAVVRLAEVERQIRSVVGPGVGVGGVVG